MKRLFVALLSLGLLVGLSGWYLLQKLDEFGLVPVGVEKEQIIELKRGEGPRSLSDELYEKGVISNPALFYYWLRYRGGFSKFQSGHYAFSGSITPTLVRDKLMRGEVYRPIALSFTIPEGFTMRQLIERLAAKGLGTTGEISALLHSKNLLDEYQIEGPHAEGFLYPATYNFETLPNLSTVVHRILKTFFDNLPTNYETSLRSSGLTLYQAVTFASLIELETMQESEKPLVAEVIWKRLKNKEALGIDAAIIYGIKNYSGDITWEHLRDTKNPYNTRIHRGLPPTPIGSPSVSSLQAVLQPSNLGYYYYMLDASDHSRHVFSKTQTEHNRNVKRYLDSLPTKK